MCPARSATHSSCRRLVKLLGLSDAIRPNQAPVWPKFPLLRLAHLVHVAAICDYYGLEAAKMPFGGTALISAAFGVRRNPDSADQIANYVTIGRYNTDIGKFIGYDITIIDRLITFRDTQAAENLRREIEKAMATDEAIAFHAAVDGGLRSAIPREVLQQAADGFSLLNTERTAATPTPAVWTDLRSDDDSTLYWRRRSRAMLLQLCKERKIKGSNPCICGSGDILRLCCLPPLRD
jgi:hypothetical protein